MGEDYKLEISSRRRLKRQDDGTCSSLTQQLDKLANLRTETEALIALADLILELTLLPDDIRTLIETFKSYHENHLEEINDEEAAKNADYSTGCGSTDDGTSISSTDDGSTDYGTTKSGSTDESINGSTDSA